MEPAEPKAPGADGAISGPDLALFRRLREAVESAVRKNGSQFFVGRAESGPAALGGLLNQGATCYLNSLVQALFHARPFRQLLYAWEFDESVHGSAAGCIPFQLQRLFARLQLSKRAAASTKALTQSFGWTAADSFQQHDAQELLHVLVDALDTTAAEDESRAEGGSAASPLRAACDVLRGRVRDDIRCCVCGHSRTREDPSLDLELTVTGNASVQAALGQFHAAELLSGSNQWHCDECGRRRDAVKSLTVSCAPPVLLLHLKRFGFDLATMRRAKVMDAFAFPAELSLGDIVASSVGERAEATARATEQARTALLERVARLRAEKEGGDGGDLPEVPPLREGAEAAAGAGGEGVGGARYRLTSVLIHTGTAMGGHYFAYSRPGEAFAAASAAGLCSPVEGGSDGEQGWVELNDAGVRVMAGDNAKALRAVLRQAAGEGAEGAEGTGPVRAGDDTPAEGAAAAAASGDGTVTAASGAGAAAPASEAGAPKAPATGVEGNAYMLVYARVDEGGEASAARGRELPPARVLAEVESENAAWLRLKRAFDVRTQLCRVHVRWPPVRNGEVTGRGGAAEEAEEEKAEEEAPPALVEVSGEPLSSSSSASGVEVPELEAALRATADASPGSPDAAGPPAAGRSALMDVPVAWGTSELLARVCAALGAGSRVGSRTLEEAAAAGLLRLRRWDPVGQRPTSVLGGDGDVRVSSLGLGAEAHAVVEWREEGEEWTAYDPHAMVVTLVRWYPAAASAVFGEPEEAEEAAGAAAGSPASPACGAPAAMLEARLGVMPGDTVLVPGGAAASSGGLATAVAASELGVPVSLQRLWVVDGDSARRVDPMDPDVAAAGGDAASLWELGLTPGCRVVVEVDGASGAGGEAEPAPGGFKAAFDAERSVIEVQFNLPARPPGAAPAGVRWAPDDAALAAADFSERVLVTKQDTLRELKRRIAGALGEGADPADFHLARNARSKEQLKDAGVLLGDSQRAKAGKPPRAGLGLVSGSVVHVRWGRQLSPDEHMVDFLLFDASQPRRPFSELCALPVREDATVASLKRVLHDAMAQQHAAAARAAAESGTEAPPPPPPASRLRLRDKTRTEAGRILRDSQTVRSALQRLRDGSEVAVQRLAEAERVGPGDMVVACRKWNPATFKLSPVTELVLDKHTPIGRLRAVVAKKFSVRRHAAAAAGPAHADPAPWAVGLAKHTQFSAPLRGATAGDSLAWSVSGPMPAWEAAGSAARGDDEPVDEAEADAAAAAAAVEHEARAAELREAHAAAVREQEALPMDEAELSAFKVGGAAGEDGAAQAASEGAAVARPPRRVRQAVVDFELDPDDAAIVAKPLTLRDGVTLVFCDERARVRARRAGVKPPAARGGGGAKGGARGARKPWVGASGGGPSGGGPRERGLAFRSGGGGTAGQESRTWSCGVCTFEQTNTADACEMCGAPSKP